MELLILAYILSKQTRPQLQEFFHVQNRLKEGLSIQDIQALQVSPYLTRILQSENIRQTWRHIEDEILRGIDEGCQFIYPGQEDYPLEYHFIEDPPLFLSYFGNPIWKKKCNLAVVGSREPSRMSEIWCEQILGETIRKVSLCIVSGGARGIDQCAHRTAIRNEGTTLVFLPSGLLKEYPSTLRNWRSAVLESGGAFMSEYLPTTGMQKHYFQQRNRLISGVSFATLVIEAKRKSGTYMTAKLAAEQSKPLFVVPSHPFDLNNQGGMDLIVEGATMVTSAEQLINMIQPELNYSLVTYADLVAKQGYRH